MPPHHHRRRPPPPPPPPPPSPASGGRRCSHRVSLARACQDPPVATVPVTSAAGRGTARAGPVRPGRGRRVRPPLSALAPRAAWAGAAARAVTQMLHGCALAPSALRSGLRQGCPPASCLGSSAWLLAGVQDRLPVSPLQLQQLCSGVGSGLHCSR
jgi:hypothetical protein